MEINATARAYAFYAEGYSQVTFSCTGLAYKMNDLLPTYKVQLRESEDATAIKPWLEREVDVRERFDGRQACHLEGGLDTPGLTGGDLLSQQHVDRLYGADLSALELLHDMVERFQGTRHAQAYQVSAHSTGVYCCMSG